MMMSSRPVVVAVAVVISGRPVAVLVAVMVAVGVRGMGMGLRV